MYDFGVCLFMWLTFGVRFHTDPSGTFMRYNAKAIGSGSEAAQSELQDKWHKVTKNNWFICDIKPVC